MTKKDECLVQDGLDLLNNEEYEKAITYFERSINIDSNYSEVYYFRGLCYLKTKEYEKALNDFDTSITLDPEDWRPRYHRNSNMTLFKSNNCKSKLSERLNVENLSIKAEAFKSNNNMGSAQYEIETVIWDSYMSILLEINLIEGDTFDNNKLENYIIEFKDYLLWIENNKKTICDALVEDEMIELAEDWVSGSEEAIIDGEKVYVDGDNIFKLPITEEDFFNSLYFNGMEIRIDEEKEIGNSRIMVDAFIDTNPDYFASHSIDVTLWDNYKISVNGLAG